MKQAEKGKKRRVTLSDVAKAAGLSRTAASMILTGRPDTRLSAEAHKKVMDAAAELGYRPNMAARSLRTDRSQSIAFISDAIATTRFASGLIRGALDAAEKTSHVMLVLETRGEPAREVEAIEAAIDRQVDGIVFASMRARELYLPETPITTPVVMLNATNPRFPASVLPDELEGGRAAVRLLYNAGHKEGIALLGQSDTEEAGLFRSEPVAQRVAGVRSEAQNLGINFIAEASCWNWEPDEGYKLTKRLLKAAGPIKAMVCMNDRLAFGAYQALTEAGLSVPGDVSIVSFDNDELASYLRPGLTTIGLPHEEMGRLSIELLLADNVAGENLVPMPVIERGSIQPAPDAQP